MMPTLPPLAPDERVSILRCGPVLGLPEYRQHGTVTAVQGWRVWVRWDGQLVDDVRRAIDLTRD